MQHIRLKHCQYINRGTSLRLRHPAISSTKGGDKPDRGSIPLLNRFGRN
jgi:hypothetical protein